MDPGFGVGVESGAAFSTRVSTMSNCIAWSEWFHSLGGIHVDWKKWVNALLSVITIAGSLPPPNLWANSSKAKCIVGDSFAYIVSDIWPSVNLWTPNATG